MWPAVAAAAAGLAGGLLGNQSNAEQGDKSRDFNANQSAEQMAFQKYMSNTAHTRQVQDLRDAGLNPILSANSGASAPQGASASSQPVKMDNVIAPAVASAMEATKMRQDLKNAQATENLTNAQTLKTATETEVAKKGIPASDFQNRVYKLSQPLLKKVEEALDSSSARYKQFEKDKRLHELNQYRFEHPAFKLKPNFHKD